MPENLFVYGTLLDVRTRRTVIGRPCRTLAATLAGYARRDGRYPYLTAEPAAHTAGLVVLRLNRAELARLDDYEGVTPSLIEGAQRRLYTRAPVQAARADGRKVACWVYLAILTEWPRYWR